MKNLIALIFHPIWSSIRQSISQFAFDPDKPINTSDLGSAYLSTATTCLYFSDLWIFHARKSTNMPINGEDRFKDVASCTAVEWIAATNGPDSRQPGFASNISHTLYPSGLLSVIITVLLRLETADRKDTTLPKQESSSRRILLEQQQNPPWTELPRVLSLQYLCGYLHLDCKRNWEEDM